MQEKTRIASTDRDMRATAERYLDACAEYTDSYEREKLIRDWIKKDGMAREVVGDFERRAGSVAGKRVLEVGFGNGLYAAAFVRAGGRVSGLEVNEELLKIAQERIDAEHIQADLHVYDGDTFPYQSDTFDYAYSISVLEHVTDARKTLAEVSRILKPGGLFYLAFPSRLRLRETHSGVYFIGYLPRSWAAFLLKRCYGRNTIEDLNLHFLTYWSMKRMLRGTGLSVRFEYGGASALRRAFKRILGALGMHHSAILGTVMVVLEKRS